MNGQRLENIMCINYILLFKRPRGLTSSYLEINQILKRKYNLKYIVKINRISCFQCYVGYKFDENYLKVCVA